MTEFFFGGQCVEGNIKHTLNCTTVLIHKTFIEFEGVRNGTCYMDALPPEQDTCINS